MLQFVVSTDIDAKAVGYDLHPILEEIDDDGEEGANV